MARPDVARPSKPTITAVLIGVVGFAWKIVDFFDGENSIQSWLDSNQHTAFGGFVATVIGWAPVFLFVGLLLWWHDYRTNRLLMQITPKPVDARADSALLVSLDDEKRKREQAERERDTANQLKEHTEKRYATMAQQREEASAEANAVKMRWYHVLNYAISYNRVSQIVTILEEAATKMNERAPSTGLSTHEAVVAIQEAAEVNKKEFDEIRPRLIQVITELRAQHSIMHPSFTDQKLTFAIVGSRLIEREMIPGLQEILQELRDKMADAAVRASLEQRP